jgi:hypothetical protein
MTIHEYQINRLLYPRNELTREIDKKLTELHRFQRRMKVYSPSNEDKIMGMINNINRLLKKMDVV